jgi:hypothetical protein
VGVDIHGPQDSLYRVASPGTCGRHIVPVRTDGPIFQGSGQIDYVCAQCGAVICQGAYVGMFKALSFRCVCGELAHVPDEADALA